MISALHCYPPENTIQWNEMQPYLFSSDEVKQVLAAISALAHCYYEQAKLDAELFYPGRMRKHNHADKSLLELQRHVCQLKTLDDIQRARALQQCDPCQQDLNAGDEMHPQFSKSNANSTTRTPKFEKFNVRTSHEFNAQFWATPRDIVIKRPNSSRKKCKNA